MPFLTTLRRSRPINPFRLPLGFCFPGLSVVAVLVGSMGHAEAPQASRPAVVAQRPAASPSSGLPRRTRWTTSRVVGSPDPAYPYRVQRAFPSLKFQNPVYMNPEPGTDRIFVVQYPDAIVRAMRDTPDCKEAPEIFRFPVVNGVKADAYSLIFHPDYQKNRRVFLFTNTKFPAGHRDQIWEYRVSDKAPFEILPATGKLVIEWPSAGHDGGDMGFGADGCLYFTAGDGTTGSDPEITGQDLTDLRASLLRIDVDHPDPGKGYGIPKDNPFLSVPKARPEIWAFGLRAPWRMSFDPPTGNLWVGEVGQDLWEMIHLVKRGGNYGWSVMEGSHPFFPERKRGPAPILPPIVEHPHSEARSITGGYVYHGKRLAELRDYYLYCCYQTGTVWGFRYEADKVRDHRVLADSTYNCAAWGRDHAGEMYLVALSGEILRLEPNPAAKIAANSFPQRLSQTGLFESVAEQRPAAGVVPYVVNAPGWHDGALLQRFLAVPNDDTINASTARGWEFSDGAVLVQTLSLKSGPAPRDARKIETRLLTRQGGEWFAYTYEWNDEQTDAQLVPKDGKVSKLFLHDASTGSPAQRTWHYLSRSDCMVCHSRAANFVLGLNTLQMNRIGQFGSVATNQLAALSAAGYLRPPLDVPPSSHAHLVDPYNDAADLETRARSYLHANCSHCHVADGGGNAKMELEITTARDKMNVIGIPPLQGKFEIPHAELIAPGDPYRSVLLYRVSKLGGGRMPQVGSIVVDHAAVDLLHRWIRSLPASPSHQAPPDLAEQRQKDEIAMASLSTAAGPAASPDDPLSALLSSTSGSMRLLRAVEERKLHPALRTKAIRTAATHSNPVVRDLFERFVPEEQRVQRLGPKFDSAALLAIQGNADRGRALFFNASVTTCQKCHQVDGKGQNVGPDLSHVGKKLSRPQLLENLVTPSKTIDEKYIPFFVQTNQGKTYTGIVFERNAETVILKDAQGAVVRIRLKDVEAFEPQKKSLMPEGLLRDLTAEQAADLLTFLESLK